MGAQDIDLARDGADGPSSRRASATSCTGC